MKNRRIPTSFRLDEDILTDLDKQSQSIFGEKNRNKLAEKYLREQINRKKV